MSYDVYIGGYNFNYTSNVSAIFYDHIPAADEEGRGGLHVLNGMTGKQAIEILLPAWDAIHSTWMGDWKSGVVGSPEFCARYDSPNGWGSTVGAMLFLARITSACASNPRKRVHVSA